MKTIPNPPEGQGVAPAVHAGKAPLSFLRRLGAGLFPLLALLLAGLGTARADIIPPGCQGNGLGISLFVDKANAHVGDTLSYSLLVSNQEFPACRATDIQSEIVTPDGVTHSITLRRTTLNPGESDLYENVVTYVVRAQDIQQPNGNLNCHSVTSATINQNISNETSQNRRDVNTLVVNPCISITAECTGSSGEGAPIAFTGTVRNCGDIALASVTVKNVTTGETISVPTTLEPGQSADFSGVYAPSGPCGGTAEFLASATDVLSSPVDVSASTSVTCGNTTTPSIALEQACPSVPPVAGDTLVFTGTVRNTGDVTLSNVAVTSDRPAPNTVVFTIDSLAPGQSASFSGEFPTPADACEISQTLVATGLSVCTSERVSDTSDHICPLAAQGTLDLAVNCPADALVPGGTAVFAGVVSNPGTVTLRDVSVVNLADPTNPVFNLGTLAPGQQAAFNAQVPVPDDVCSVTASFAASASDRCDNSGITASDSATCLVHTAPSIAVTHDCPADTLVPGTSSTFGGSVQNTGNVTLNQVTVTSGEAVLLGPISLAPGQTASFTGSVTAPAGACTVTTTVAASGVDACSDVEVSNVSTRNCPVQTNPAIVVTKECPQVAPAPGGELTYFGSVRNAGDVTLTSVVVTDGAAVVFGPATLAPGESRALSQTTRAPVTGCSVTSQWVAKGNSECTGEEVGDTDSVTCPIATSAGLDVSISCPAQPALAGGQIVYTGVVVNTGDVALQDVQVRSDQSEAPVLTLPTLAAGAQAPFSFTVSVPEDTCKVSASVSASAADECGGRGVTAGDSATCPVLTQPAIAVAHDCPSSISPGGVAVLSGSVMNTGNVTLDGVVVSNGEQTVFGPTTLAPGQSASFEASVPVPADTCSLTTTLLARGINTCTDDEVTSSSTQVCQVPTQADFVLTKKCPDSPSPSGGTITYRGSLANTGNVTLLNLAVADQGALVISVPSLAPGAVTNFTFTAAVPPNVCSVTDTWVATGSGKCDSTPITREATTTCSVFGSPQVDLAVNCSGAVQAGGTATYTGTVANTGNVTLTNVVVFGSSISEEPVFSAAQLLPGGVASFVATVPVPTDLCELTSTFSVTAADNCAGQTTSDSASASCPVINAPALAVSHECPPEPAVPGVPTSFHGRVTNTGNVTLTNVTVLHNLVGAAPVFGPASLAPGQSADFTGTYVVDSSQATCSYVSQVSASGADKCSGQTVSAQDTNHCGVQFLPGIEVELNCGEPVPQGAVMAYTGVVRNTGNVQLNNVRLVSSNTGNERVVAAWAAIPAGAEVPFGLDPRLGIYVTNNCCTVTHTVTVTAVDNCGSTEVSDTATRTCDVLYHPKLAVTKECPPDPVMPGDTLWYKGTVSNPGDVTLVNVYVRNLVKGTSTDVLGPLVLVPGQTVNFKRSYVVPEDFCGDSELIATGDTLCGKETGITASVATQCQVDNMPGIFVVKDCPSVPVSSGGEFTYTGTVMNVGNITLTDVMVYSDQPAPNTPVFGPVTIPAGESQSFTASYQLSTECCQSVDMLTVRGKDACNGAEVSNTGASACPVLYSPSIRVTKSCAGSAFTGTVENTGDITLQQVVVSAGGAQLLGPIELAPGEVKHFAGGEPTDVGTSALGDVPVVASAVSLCGNTSVSDSATCTSVGPTSLAIQSIAPAGDGYVITWSAVPGATYRVECSNSLSGSEWQPVGDDVRATAATASQTDAQPTDGGRFYRVRQLTE